MCGLKHEGEYVSGDEFDVTPFVGVWIETLSFVEPRILTHVTPFVGVWIETESGCLSSVRDLVTPFVGVWIET